jgi:hypothetical protein
MLPTGDVSHTGPVHAPLRRRTVIVPFVVVGVLVALAVAAVLAFPAFITAASPVEERHYATWADAPSAQEDLAAARPAWAPADATDIDMQYRVRRDAPGWNVAMTVPNGFDPSGCTAVRLEDASPALDSSFMPHRLPDHGWTCGDGRAVWTDGHRLYGATTGTALAGR